MARPFTMTKEKIDDMCKLIAETDLGLDQVATIIGVGISTVWRYKHDAKVLMNNRDQALALFTEDYVDLLDYFIEQTAIAVAQNEQMLLGVIKNCALEGDWRAAKYMLEKRHGYNDSQVIEVRRGNAKMDVAELSSEELEQMLLDSGNNNVDQNL